jgi:hypothetical protein
MVRRLWDGLPKHEIGMVADPTTVRHNGQVVSFSTTGSLLRRCANGIDSLLSQDYHLRFPRWLKELKVRAGTWESGFWMRVLDHPEGGSVLSFRPTIRLSCHSPELEHVRWLSRPLRYDKHVGFLFDAEDPEGIEQGLTDLIKVGDRTYRARSKEETEKLIDGFLERKSAVRGMATRL